MNGVAMLHTTLALLKKHKACTEGYEKLVKHLGGVKQATALGPIPLSTVLESNGLEDTLWCLRAVLPEEEAERDKIARLFACDCAEAVARLYHPPTPDTGWRPAQTILVSRRHALGMASAEELESAFDVARAAARAAAWTAAWTASSTAVMDVAWAAARAAARAAAWTAARAAAFDAAFDAAREAQATLLREWLEGTRTAEQVERALGGKA